MITFKSHVFLFWQWWVDELYKLIPMRVFKLFHRKSGSLIYSIDGENIYLKIQNKNNKLQTLCSLLDNENNFEEILLVIKKYLNKHTKTKFGICVNESACLIRDLSYPISAKTKLQEILELELEQRTPFQKGEVYCGYILKSVIEREKIFIQNVILKKNIVSKHTNLLKDNNLSLDFIDVWDKKKEALLNCNLLPLKNEKYFFSKYKLAMYLGIFSLIVLLANAILAKQQYAIKDLKQRITSIKKNNKVSVQKKNTIFNRKNNVQALYNSKYNKTAYIVLWRELTHILSDSVWLTDLKINRDNMQIVGYAQSAASLIEVIDNSTYFHKSKLISQIRFDKKTGKEQFSIITYPSKNIRISAERKR